MDKVVTALGAIILGVVLIVVLGLILALPVMWLWNGALIPAVPFLKEIGWLQAWGISILCGLLFKSSLSND